MLKTINKRFQQKNHMSYLIRISSIIKLTKLSKFEFEVRFLKNQKNYKNSIFGSIEPNRKKHQNNAKIRVRYGRTISTKVRYGSVRSGTVLSTRKVLEFHFIIINLVFILYYKKNTSLKKDIIGTFFEYFFEINNFI